MSRLTTLKWQKEHPWWKHYALARERCKPQNKYGKRGIKFLMTMNDFKCLWIRDRANEMKRPSIDRIDNNGDYAISNCRFIELSENSRRGNLGLKHPHTQKTKEKMSETHTGKPHPHKGNRISEFHCPNNHLYTPENTYINPRGHRECKICRKESQRKWKLKTKN